MALLRDQHWESHLDIPMMKHLDLMKASYLALLMVMYLVLNLEQKMESHL